MTAPAQANLDATRKPRAARLLALAAVVLWSATVEAAPTVTVRARTRIRIDTVARTGEDGIRVVGRLVDALTGEPVPGRLVGVRLGESNVEITTDPRGVFEADFERPAGIYEVSARFAGDQHYADARHEGQRFDVGKDTLELSLRTKELVDYDEEAMRVLVDAVTALGARSVEVQLFLEDAQTGSKGRLLETVVTGEIGSTTVRIERERLGRAGDKRLHARFAGNDAFNPAETTARFRLVSATELVDLDVPEGAVRFEGKIQIKGRLVETGGHAVDGVTMNLLAGDKQIAAATTDKHGKFTLRVSASEFTPGPVALVVEHASQVSWRRGVRSAQQTVVVAEPRPVPVRYTVLAFAATAAALVTFLLVRSKPWIAWRERWRRRRRAPGTVSEGAANGRDVPVEAGLKPARPGIMSTLRRAADFGFSGLVRDVVRGQAVAGARLSLELDGADAIALETDARGAFAVERIAPGAWRARVAAPGYVTETFAVTVPHRGELRGVRIDLMPVRERVFAIYREVAAPLLPRPDLWGIWTPREIFRHVRKKRPAGALGQLTNFVEETYFSARIPDESALASAVAGADAARAELAPPN